MVQVETQFIILRCEGRTEPVVTSLDEVKDQLVEDLRERKTQELVAVLFNQLKEEIRVDNYLTNRSEGRTTGNSGAIRQTGTAAGEGGEGEKVVPATPPAKRVSKE